MSSSPKIILHIIGTRPNYMKLMPVHEALVERGVESLILDTGQHWDTSMAEQFAREFQCEPDWQLVADEGYNALGRAIERFFEDQPKFKPDLAVIYGDVDSSLAGALACVKNKIPIVHVEAGVRTSTLTHPELVNRVVIDSIASAHFCSSTNDVYNLNIEGISAWFTGDPMLDTFNRFWEDIPPANGDHLLLTMHRRETLYDTKRLRKIIDNLRELQKLIIFPMHPHTQKILLGQDLLRACEEFMKVRPPAGYTEMMWYLKSCTKVITDSGGLQKEAYFAKKPCINLQEESTWPQILGAGGQVLAGDDLVKHVQEFEIDLDSYRHLFGDGQAGPRIADYILDMDLSQAMTYQRSL